MKTLVLSLCAVLALGLALQTDATASDAATHTGAVSGIVVGPHGLPVAGAVVELEVNVPGHPRPFLARTHTERDGRFLFRMVPAGPAVVTARKLHVGRDRARTLVVAGHRSEVRLRLH